MDKHTDRQMGHSNSNVWLQNRVHESATVLKHKGNKDTVRDSTEVSTIERGNSFGRKESNIQNLSSFSARVLGLVFPSAQKDRRLAPHTQPQTSESIHQTSEVSHGKLNGRHEGKHQTQVGNFPRFKGRLSSRAYRSMSSQMAKVSRSGSGLRLQMSSLRPIYGAKGVHKGSEDSSSTPSSRRFTNLHVPRRLVNTGTIPRSYNQRYKEGDTVHRGPRFHHQHEQITVDSIDDTYISGGSVRPNKWNSHPISGENFQFSPMCTDPERGQTCSGIGLAQGLRSHGEHGGLGPLLQAPHETYSVTRPFSFQIINRSSLQNDPNDKHDLVRPTLVDSGQESTGRSLVSGPLSSDHAYSGRIEQGMGSTHGSQYSPRSLVKSRGTGSHKPIGTVGSSQRFDAVTTRGYQQKSTSEVRQLYGGGLCEQTGRDKVPDPVSTHQETLDVVHRQQYNVDSSTYTRGKQCTSRQPVKRSVPETNRMVSIQTSLPNTLLTERVSNHRSVCIEEQSSTTSLLLPVTGSSSTSVGCSFDSVGQDGSLRVPPDIATQRSNTESIQRRLHSSADSANVVEAGLVSQPNSIAGRLPCSTTNGARSTSNARDKGQVSRHRSPTVNCLDIVKRRFQKEGFSEGVAHLASRGRRESTNKVYSARLRRYYTWCSGNKVDPHTAPVTQVAEFLKSRFDQGLQTTTVRGYLSAVNSVHNNSDALKSDPVIKLLLEGMNISRPMDRKVWPSWDLHIVLDKLNQAPFEPIESASLRDVALKTLFLIAMASGRRCSELHALSVGSRTVFSKSGVTLYFRPGFLAKNERSDFSAKPIFLPYITQSQLRVKRLGCPVRALKWYINRTKTIRGNMEQLFITNVKPHRPAAKSTLAGWLVDVIRNSGSVQDAGIPRAHSVRAYSASWAFAKGLSISDIINTVSWRTGTTFVKTYLKEVGTTASKGKYAKSVLQHTHDK